MFIDTLRGYEIMGKAFTEDERASVQEKLRRTGLDLFARKGIKGVSIRDLTSTAGIAQGGFYTFYKDKDDFLADLIELRVSEKLEAMRDGYRESIDDPVGFLSGMLYSEGMHLKENKAFDNMISGTLSFFNENKTDIHERVSQLYRNYLEELAAYWNDNGYAVSMDVDGFLNLILAVGIMFSNASLLDDAYFKNIFRCFCESGTAMFLKVGRIDAGNQ